MQHAYTIRGQQSGGGMGTNAEYAGTGDPTGMRAYAAAVVVASEEFVAKRKLPLAP